MKRSLDIPDNLYERLKRMSEKKGITVAALIKFACSEYLEKEEKNRGNAYTVESRALPQRKDVSVYEILYHRRKFFSS